MVAGKYTGANEKLLHRRGTIGSYCAVCAPTLAAHVSTV
jgi:hypothetical protein